ncbi:MAG: hypothetical protein B6I24_01095 [Bacteroidetes bacterium 4572_128]|nr:MAG: hypothetical protein B6I24_01095 [Bacteroidetes bacterium 4572_128]
MSKIFLFFYQFYQNNHKFIPILIKEISISSQIAVQNFVTFLIILYSSEKNKKYFLFFFNFYLIKKKSIYNYIFYKNMIFFIN